VRRVAISQSSYVPWRAYFDAIASVDDFVLLDDVQYTRRDWRNRNRIVTPQGLRWLTIPVVTKGRYRQRIDEVEVADPAWREVHWRTLRHAYRRAPGFDDVAGLVEDLYRGADAPRLSAINRRFLAGICDFLGIRTPLRASADFPRRAADPSGRLLEICRALGATDYFSGPSARAYLDEERFAAAGVRVRYWDYGGYPAYPQATAPFEPAVSVLDLLFNAGRRAPAYMKLGRG